MRFCVIGAGAMGALYGGRLRETGHDVVLVDAWGAHVEAIRRDGLRLQGPDDDRRIAIDAAHDTDPVAPADVAIVFTDANSTAAAGAIAARVLGADGYAVTLQNGIGNIEILTEALGPGRFLAGLSYHSAAVAGPGHIHHTHRGTTWLGELDGRKTARLDALVAAFDAAGLRPTVVDDIVGFIWDKWILNSAINPVSAITGLRQGEIPRTPEVDELQTRIIDEILAVVAAKGIRLHNPDIKDAIKAQCWKKFNKPSMQQHIEAGKRTEIDALNGAVVRLARELGVPVPFNEALTMMIKGREKCQRQLLREAPIDYEAFEKEAAETPRPA